MRQEIVVTTSRPRLVSVRTPPTTRAGKANTMNNNPVKEAVDAVGGPTRVANLLGVSSSTVHSWIKKGRVPNFDHSETLAQLANASAAVLRGEMVLSKESFRHLMAKTRLREAMLDYLQTEYGFARSVLDRIEVGEMLLPSRRGIKAGVISLVVGLELGGGSGLYELLETYLRNPAGSDELRKIVQAHYKETLRLMSQDDAFTASSVDVATSRS